MLTINLFRIDCRTRSVCMYVQFDLCLHSLPFCHYFLSTTFHPISFDPLPHNPDFYQPLERGLFENILRKVENAGNQHFLLFSKCFLPIIKRFSDFYLTLCQMTNFRLFQTEKVCRRQFQVWWKWHKNLQKGRKYCGKRRNCSLQAISPFSTVFSKDLYCRHLKTKACLGKG